MLTPEERRAKEIADLLSHSLNGVRDQLISLNVTLTQLAQQQVNATSQRDTAPPRALSPPAGAISVITESSSAEKADSQAEQKRNYTLQRRALWVQMILCLATLGAFGSATYYAFIAVQQRDMMESQWLSMVGQWVTMSKTLGEIQKQTIAAQVSADAAKSSADTASLALMTSERPWVKSVFEISDPLTFSKGYGNVRIGFLLKNVGTAPALHVQLHSKLMSLPGRTFQDREIVAAEESTCGPLRKRSSTVVDFTLFPGDETSREWPAAMSPPEIAEAVKIKQSGVLAHPGFVSLVLIACVDYQISFGKQDSFGREHRQTRYGFLMGIPQGVGIMGDIKPEGIRPEVRLVYLNETAN
jgi:hypothetical protein